MSATSGQWGPAVEGFKFLRQRLPYGTYYIKRKPRPVSLGTKDLAEAIQRYTERIGKPLPKRGDIRNREAHEHFLATHKMSPATHKLYESTWRLYCGRIHGLLVSEVTPEHVIGILDEARGVVSEKTGRRLSEDRLNHIYVGLSAYFTAVSQEPTRYRDDNPVSKIGPYKPDTTVSGSVGVEEVLSLDEVRRLAEIAAIPSYVNRRDEVLYARQMELLIWVLAYSGMRLGEALALQLSDLGAPSASARYGEWRIERQLNLDGSNDDPSSWFSTMKGKDGKIGSRVRFVPVMNADLRERLDAYITEGLEGRWLRPGGLLFPNAVGRPRSVSGVGNKFREIKNRAGFERKLVCHHLRHTFVSWLLESGQFQIEGIALMVGHSVEVCRARYAHLGDRTAFNQQAVEAMAVRHGEPVEPEPAAPAAVSNVIQFPARRSA